VDRTAAFNLPHELGLVQFATDVTERSKITATFGELRTSLEELKEEGETRMHDAIDKAADMLEAWKANVILRRRDQGKQHLPEPRMRIVCLSDGADTKSTNPLHRVAQRLRTSGIVLDGVLVGTSTNEPLH